MIRRPGFVKSALILAAVAELITAYPSRALSSETAGLNASAENSREKLQQGFNLQGIISIYDGPNPEQILGELVNEALQRDEANSALQKKDKQMKGVFQRSLAGLKIGANFISEYRGFELSSEGADIILNEKLKLKSHNATAFARQKKLDEAHCKVFASLLQLGQGLGSNVPEQREKIIDAGLSQLSGLVGKEKARETLDKMQSWSQHLNVRPDAFRTQSWSVMELQQNSESLLHAATQSDPVMGLVRRALHRYNGHSKLALGAAKLINTSLSVAMFSPTIVSPIAQILSFIYTMSTGGPEDMKLLSELYLDKRMECRWKRLSRESEQVINSYNNAVLTKNPVLLGLSESFISTIGGEGSSSKILGANHLFACRNTHNDSIDCVQTHETEKSKQSLNTSLK